MLEKRRIEVFTAGCGLCEDTIEMVESAACSSCDVTILDMKDAETIARAMELGVKSVPAVAIDGVLASCCSGRGVDLETLKAAGLGRA
ncbi:MAG: thioredoxin family protein [Rhodospirillales bacterium]